MNKLVMIAMIGAAITAMSTGFATNNITLAAQDFGASQHYTIVTPGGVVNAVVNWKINAQNEIDGCDVTLGNGVGGTSLTFPTGTTLECKVSAQDGKIIGVGTAAVSISYAEGTVIVVDVDAINPQPASTNYGPNCTVPPTGGAESIDMRCVHGSKVVIIGPAKAAAT